MPVYPLRKYKYWIETLSTLALSPREQHAFTQTGRDFTMEDIEQQASENLKKEGVRIIYPFYQYGTYSCYAPTEAQYYIPGSSIKGALSLESNKQRIMVDDIKINSKDIQLFPLQKLQYDSKKNKSYIDEFFPNVAIEMLRADSKYLGELFCDELEVDNYFRKAEQATKTKLHQLVRKICQVAEQVRKEKDQHILCKLKDNIQDILNKTQTDNNKFILLLGGFKGLALSVISDSDDYNGAIFIDMTKSLPHGLVQITLEKIDV
ncbi:hypothetical protein J27TS8_38720 [Robertmurraya siralis]|uniref:Uncharacterized protein n=1 Tax=Robertmurraya siralis TaxID=77777 RepID=A0A919WLE0_9BACI|nr:hypothetical protein [Robertmurraya siralis]GIN63879.1 hypothetical protein J27TS8_38720 [Robertmurraya siralis]